MQMQIVNCNYTAPTLKITKVFKMYPLLVDQEQNVGPEEKVQFPSVIPQRFESN